MDYQKLAQQIITSLRSGKSQAWVNQKLNANSNLVHRWEKGHSKTPWSDFLKLLKIFKIDINKLLKSYFRYSGDPENICEMLTHILGNRSLKNLEQSSGLSSAKLRRLKSGESALNLGDFLNLVFAIDDMESLSLCYKFTNEASIPLLDERKQQFSSLSNKYHSNPNYGLILVCLNLPSYQQLSFHQDSFLARVSGIPIKEVHDILTDALESGLIEKTKTVYKVSKFKVSDRGTPEQMINSRKFWLNKALQNASVKSSQDVYGSIVLATSQQAREKIIARYLKFFEDFKEIVDNDTEEDPNKIIPLVLNFQLFHPGEEN